jgi:drug/metabolite transporter (DMT)-like permease
VGRRQGRRAACQTAAVIAILGGLASAVLWATTLLGSAASARRIGSWSTLGWVMLVGLVVAVPLVIASPPVALTSREVALLAVAGIANSGGLLLVYTALQRGKIAVVGPIVSTEGAIGAVLAILAGDRVAGPVVAILALIAVGVVMAAFERARPATMDHEVPPVSATVTALLALGGALLFGINLFATSRIAADLPIAWTVLPARVAGVVGVTIPLAAGRRLRLTRPVAPFVLVVGLAEVAGTATYAFGSRDSAAIAAVLASQFAAIAALAAFFLFRERLNRVQLVGVAVIITGVMSLALLRG